MLRPHRPMAPVPSMGQADVGIGGAPLGVTEQTATKVILPPTSESTKLSLVLVVPSMVGASPQAKALAS